MQPAKRLGRMLCNAITLTLRKENRKKINLDIPEELLGIIFAQLPLAAFPKTLLVSKE